LIVASFLSRSLLMLRLLCLKQTARLLIAIALFVIPAFSQDDGDGGGGGFNVNDLFGASNFPDQPERDLKAELLVDLRSWLTRASAPPLEKKQEKPLQKVYDQEVKALGKPFEKRFGLPLDTALAAQPAARGRRGGGGGRMSPALAAEVRRLSDQIVNKVIAALRLDQQAALRRHQSEELRVQRLNLVTQSMTAAGLPLTPEQKAQVEAVYARESRLRTLIVVEAKGQPHAHKVAQLETQTTQSVEQLMNQTQKTALAEALAKSRTR
jgi:hypothetical protein